MHLKETKKQTNKNSKGVKRREDIYRLAARPGRRRGCGASIPRRAARSPAPCLVPSIRVSFPAPVPVPGRLPAIGTAMLPSSAAAPLRTRPRPHPARHNRCGTQGTHGTQPRQGHRGMENRNGAAGGLENKPSEEGLRKLRVFSLEKRITTI